MILQMFSSSTINSKLMDWGIQILISLFNQRSFCISLSSFQLLVQYDFTLKSISLTRYNLTQSTVLLYQVKITIGMALAVRSLVICFLYGVMAIFQTLNSRYLYRNLNFHFYSFAFGIQRIVIIAIFFWKDRRQRSKSMLMKILPFSFFMCLSNILSSYCLTVMPLAAFLSFKKLNVLFIMALSIILKLPVRTNNFQNFCIIGIIMGGAMVGQKDLLYGNAFGYFASLMFNLSQAIVLQYSAYLYRQYNLQPSQLILYNCMIGLPYYISMIAYKAEFDDIYFYFRDHFSFIFLFSFLLAIILACLSELSANYISMKISPFQKSTVSNIKDLVLMLISIFYFYDLHLNYVTGMGIILCLFSSALFSLPYLKQTEENKQYILEIPNPEELQIGQNASFLKKKSVIKHHSSNILVPDFETQTISMSFETRSQKL